VQRKDIAAIVAVGFMPLEVGQMLPSKMYRFGMSCVRPHVWIGPKVLQHFY